MKDSDNINITLSWRDFRRLLVTMDSDPVTFHEILKPVIKEKLDKMMKRELYTTYKTAESDEEREQARQRYLDEVGVPSEFRW